MPSLLSMPLEPTCRSTPISCPRQTHQPRSLHIAEASKPISGEELRSRQGRCWQVCDGGVARMAYVCVGEGWIVLCVREQSGIRSHGGGMECKECNLARSAGRWMHLRFVTTVAPFSNIFDPRPLLGAMRAFASVCFLSPLTLTGLYSQAVLNILTHPCRPGVVPTEFIDLAV